MKYILMKAHEFSFTGIKIIENKNYALKIDNKKTTLNKGTQCSCSSHNKQCSLDSSTHNVYEYHKNRNKTRKCWARLL